MKTIFVSLIVIFFLSVIVSSHRHTELYELLEVDEKATSD